ncbi:homolog 1, mitochondrial-like [Octopus vulgaris]|uniref:GrpE protein homolog n=1 Tax=Octopus vulgaris TaxID=6645 RepID=A0AA36BGE8_OCTVU|nr:homolog 1, mitochondrial-like [Octopus vulgaris]
MSSYMLSRVSLNCRRLPRYFFNSTKLNPPGFTLIRIGRQFSAAAESNKVAEGSNTTTAAPPPGAADAVHNELNKELLEENKKLTENVKKMKDKYLLALAESENVRMRMNKQIQDAKLFSIQGFCRDLFEVADILTKATESVPKEELEMNQHLKDLFEGLSMTEIQLQKVFNKHAIEQIIPKEGDKFDPYLHEAMFEVSCEGKEAGTVATLTKLGYKLHNRTVRPAVVGVYKAM